YQVGFGGSDDPGSYNSIVSALFKNWKGAAADEFAKHTDSVRDFATRLAAQGDPRLLSSSPAGDQWWYDDMAAFLNVTGYAVSELSNAAREWKVLQNDLDRWAYTTVEAPWTENTYDLGMEAFVTNLCGEPATILI